MSAFCLIKDQANAFIQGLKDGKIDVAKLAEMESKERNAFLADIVGKENATQVNALFESKLLLKNQQKGMINWINKVAGLTPATKRDLLTKVSKMDRILSPEESKAFYKDLASTRLGADVTREQAKTIYDLAKKVEETKSLQNKDLTFNTEAERMAYGRAKVEFGNYVNDLKNETNKSKFLSVKTLTNLPGTTKSIKASLDNSAIFRQGWKTLFTNPIAWQRNARKTFVDAVRTFGGKNVMDEITADIISRPNYELMQKAKLAVSTIEEAFPSSLPEKIPGIGRAYKASETAYTGFVHRMRADVFDKYIQIAKKTGVELTDKELKSIGSMVNSLVGRGDAKFLNSGAVNNVFFSPRNVKAQIDTFLHPLTGAGGSNFVRKQAAINLLKVISGTATILAVANAVRPGSVEWDSRSSDFGKIRVGNTRFDVTGGISSLVTLASRLATMSSKSSTTKRVTPLNSGEFGSQTGLDVVENFFENKLSPVASVIKDILKGQDFKGNKPTIPGELSNLFVPIGITTAKELYDDPNSPNIILAMIADGLGIGANTYGQTQKEWNQKPTKAQEAFKSKVGADKFKQANQDFNKQYDDWFGKVVVTKEYKDLSDDSKQALINEKKEKLQNKIFANYGFKYVAPKNAAADAQEKNVSSRLLNQ